MKNKFRFFGSSQTRNLLCLSLFGYAGTLLGAMSSSASEVSAPIVLGQSAAFSGTSSHFGQQTWLGSQTYFDEINRKGGINGRKIEVIALNDAYDPELTEKNTREFLQRPDLFALFSYVGTPTLVRALPLILKSRESGSKVFLFSNRTGAKQQRTPPYESMVLNIRASYGEETEQLIRHLVTKMGKKKIALFIQDDAYGLSGKDGVTAALQKQGLSVVVETKYVRGAKFSESMKSQVEKVRSQDVDAVVSIASYEAAAAFVRDSRVSGFSGPIVNISFVGAQDMLNLLKAEGLRSKKDLTQNLFVSQVLPPVSEIGNSLVKEYVELTSQHHPVIPKSISQGEEVKQLSFGGLEGFLNAKVFVELLKRAKEPLTQESFLAAAESDFTLDLGFEVPLKFSKKEHQGLHQVWMTEVVGGEFVLVSSKSQKK